MNWKPHVIAGGVVLLLASILYTTMFRAAETAAEPVPERNTEILPDITIQPAATPDESQTTPTGSGATRVDRNYDFDHVVSDGETLSEIAYVYKINTQKLAVYNSIANIHSIRAGDVIKIPSFAKEMQLAQRQNISKVRIATSVATHVPDSVPDLVIAAQEQYDGHAVTAHFAVQAPKDVQLTGFEWNLGNGRKSFRPNTFWTYERPGTYRISLKARLPNNRLVESNEILIDVPHPTTYQAEYQSFITLSSVEEQIALTGELLGILGYPRLETAPVEVVASNFDTTIYHFTKAGYFTLEIENDGIRSNVYVYVSPMPSIHVERTDLNWYRTQFNTGEQSNCGPATVSMAVAWAKGEYVPVSTVRQQVGWHEERLGATTLEELHLSLMKNDVNVRFRRLYSAQNLFQVIDSGNIAIVLLETGEIPRIQSRPLDTPFGRYYEYSQGHYVVVKGYTKDKRYVIVHDPIPSDWGSNSMRYSDGISMIGRNRFYAVDDFLKAIRKKRSDFLEIWQ